MPPVVTVSDPTSTTRARIRVLVVDDSVDHRTLIAHRLRRVGMQVATAKDRTEALAQLGGIDLVLLDYRLPGSSGIEVLEEIRRRPQPPSVIMVTGAGSIQVAVEAMRAGASNFLAKDAGYLDALPEVVERAWRHHDLAARAAELQRLALLVSSASDLDQLFLEIVSGATRLLRATGCALLLAEEEGLVPVAARGPDRPDLLALADRIGQVAPTAGAEPWAIDGYLIVPLPREADAAAGVLALWTGDRAITDEEVQLARVFASFAGIALRNLRQFELERMLVTELQQTLDARRDFVASVSHELRTPLTSIAGFNATLSSHWRDLDDEQRDDLLRRVGRNAAELRDLVDQLLELAAVERGRSRPPQLEPLELRDHVLDTIAQLEHVLEGRTLAIEIPPVEVHADASLLRRTLGNLLTNAVKFSAAESPIAVVAERDGDRVRVAVVDEGIGLPAWEASRVFDPFFRARTSVANAVRGTGIGLSLVREYVRAMGGEVSVESAPGEGSTFAFTLPVAGPVVDLTLG
jgi:signal transduction histidine kinase